jgi:phospholipase C
MKRRDVLKMGALAGAAGMAKVLPGCGVDGGPGEIDTVIYLMMENRSYDHWLGARSMNEALPGDGLAATMSNLDLAGNPVPVFEGVDGMMCIPDPSHGWEASHVQFNGGVNDGFLATHQMEHPGDLGAMQYLTRTHLPVTWALADEYATCDRWFASVMGPTWPNRYYWMSATSMGLTDNRVPEGGYTAPTIFGRMDDAGVPWKIYYSDLPFVALLGANSDVELTDRLWRMEDFFHDCEMGTLPNVVYLDPPFTMADDHPPHHPIVGQQFLAAIYNAVSSSPQWERTLLVITYDEHGGFYDHVAPPTTDDERTAEGFDQLGFRVPTLVIGPYVKRGHVSSVVRDHTSALKHIENTFGTAPLTARSTAAADLSELIDETRLAAGDASVPIELPEVQVDEWMMTEACNASTLFRKDHDILRISDAHPELVERWDRRGEVRSLMAAVAARARRK